jgi:PPOX class probable F420-dependent enzyme
MGGAAGAFDRSMTDDTALKDFIGKHRRGVLATIRRDGRPQLSTITHLYNPDTNTITASITETRAKTKNMRRDPRVTYHVSSEDGWSYAVADARAELSEPAKTRDDATVEALVDYYRRASGEHPNWDEYRDAMVSDQRVLLTLHIDRVLGLIR